MFTITKNLKVLPIESQYLEIMMQPLCRKVLKGFSRALAAPSGKIYYL
jgi:hypothetical protein